MSTEKKTRTWVKDLLVAFAATTLSIILTFGTTGVINRVKQKQERRLTALMVMSSIEQSARDLEEVEEILSHMDSVTTWVLSLPVEDVARLSEEQTEDVENEIFVVFFLSHDKTAETIFSSNIDTWKNLGNFQFINSVGASFSQMNFMEEYYNNALTEYQAALENISNHPDEYPGSTLLEKCLRNEPVRQQLLMPARIRDWLAWSIADLRKYNRKNMRLIGISEQEVMDFTDDLGAGDEVEEEPLEESVLKHPKLVADSVAVQLPLARQIESVLHANK